MYFIDYIYIPKDMSAQKKEAAYPAASANSRDHSPAHHSFISNPNIVRSSN